MRTVEITAEDIRSIEAILMELANTYSSISDHLLAQLAAVYAHELPRRLRASLNDYRILEQDSALSIRGFFVNDNALGSTPTNWVTRETSAARLRCEFFLLLCAALLGDPISWETQQHGKFMHDLVPIRDHEGYQINSSSVNRLTWHTEDASQSYFADYLLFMCLRNPQRVATRLSSIADVRLNEATRQLLFEHDFAMQRDLANQGSPTPEMASTLSSGTGAMNRPIRSRVLFGNHKSPYVRLDSYFIDVESVEPDVSVALNELLAEFERHASDVILTPGDVLVIDNYRTVHGREPFVAAYDGTDRWLKRISVARSLRAFRATSQDVDQQRASSDR